MRNPVTSITPDPTIGGPGISFTYTFTGKRQTMTDTSGVTTYTYDNRDRLKTKATPQGALTYTYDATSKRDFCGVVEHERCRGE